MESASSDWVLEKKGKVYKFEIWHANRKKLKKIAIDTYNSELITSERKQIFPVTVIVSPAMMQQFWQMTRDNWLNTATRDFAALVLLDLSAAFDTV